MQRDSRQTQIRETAQWASAEVAERDEATSYASEEEAENPRTPNEYDSNEDETINVSPTEEEEAEDERPRGPEPPVNPDDEDRYHLMTRMTRADESMKEVSRGGTRHSSCSHPH
ncbi:GH22372 [Drosophila grimshawi]|uniref:GH22372 n=1 Tax=Drosophila grimshawi TaxID=7222 RepID=B4JYV4_DROGR|nr:GH22372 [Drosophila grimshawi]